MKRVIWDKNKWNKNYFEFLILLLLAVITVVSYRMLNVRKEEKSHQVSVIVDNSNSDRWMVMREGLEQAALDSHITLNFVSTGDILGKKEEETLMKRELENGADGLIIQMVTSFDVSNMIEEISSKAAVILIESDITPEEIYTTVMPDNEEIGKAIGQAVINDLGEHIIGKKLGVICDNQMELSMVQRLEGLKSSLREYGVKVTWTIAVSSEYLSTKLTRKQNKDPVDLLVSLDNDTTEAAAELLQKSIIDHKNCMLYGEGCSEKNVYYLDKGIIKTLVVPNEFNMGYLSVAAIAKQLKYKLPSMENTHIDFLVINKDNLYDEDNQKILFPIVQ